MIFATYGSTLTSGLASVRVGVTTIRSFGTGPQIGSFAKLSSSASLIAFE